MPSLVPGLRGGGASEGAPPDGAGGAGGADGVGSGVGSGSGGTRAVVVESPLQMEMTSPAVHSSAG
eukprot:3892220-Prymnesium_polylepis.1